MGHSPGRDTEQQHTSVNTEHTNYNSIDFFRSFIERSGISSTTAEHNPAEHDSAEYAFTKHTITKCEPADFAFTSCTIINYTSAVGSCGAVVHCNFAASK